MITLSSNQHLQLQLGALAFLLCLLVSANGQSFLNCDNNSTDASGYRCNAQFGPHSQQQQLAPQDHERQCATFAVLRANSFYSSLSNLSSYLGINRLRLTEANGFPADTEFLSFGQLLLIPIDCKCNPAGFFEAQLTKTTLKGDSFYGIAQSLEGLTTCKAIQDKNPRISPWNLPDKFLLPINVRCACPSFSSLVPLESPKILLSYPVNSGDTLSSLAAFFNVTPQNILSANNRTEGGAGLKPESLVPASTLLIPLRGKPIIKSQLQNPPQPPHFVGYPAPFGIPKHKKKKKKQIGIYMAISGVALAMSIAAFFYVQRRRKKKKLLQESYKMGDMEQQQQHNLSVRTTATTTSNTTSRSDKKVSFEGLCSHPFDGHIIDTGTPHKMMQVERYTTEELRKATEEFNSGNLIEGSVFHGRLSGKNLAVKRTSPDTVSKIEFGLFHHYHPNIIRLLGTCVNSNYPDSYLVFEYATNGSLKDWLHGGLAIKSQFISSCYCFLTWSQRLRICLDVATALQYMHHVMNPSYIHRHIKTRNIFLDEEFNAKIGNFGMARCISVEDATEDHRRESYISSRSVSPASWSRGYLAPEFLHRGVVAPSIDIFAYGVVLLEVLSGQTPITGGTEEKGDGGNNRLSERIKIILKSENAEELKEWMDKAMGDNYSLDAAVALANIARACTEDDPSLRPHAGEIVLKLSRLVEELPEGDYFSICESSCKPLVN